METSTASEGSSGGAPWTVVTSPRKGPQEDEVTSPEKAEGTAASAAPSKAASVTSEKSPPTPVAKFQGESLCSSAAGCRPCSCQVVLYPAMLHTTCGKPNLGDPTYNAIPWGFYTRSVYEVLHGSIDALCFTGVPAPTAEISPVKDSAQEAPGLKENVPAPKQETVADAPSLKAATAAPKTAPAPAAGDDDDLEISNEEGLAAEDGGSEVDEDWGWDWE